MMMDYLSTYMDGTLHLYSSDMILTLESYSTYLVLPKSRIQSAGWCIFGQDPATVTNPINNAPFHAMCNTIKNFMASADKSETGVIFIGGQICIPMGITDIKICHAQPSNGTPFYCNNKTAKGILTSIVRQKLYKVFDIRFYWMRYQIAQKSFEPI